MSKDNEQPKMPNHYKQGKLFEGKGIAMDKPDGGTIRNAMRAELESRLKEQRTLTTGIVDKIADYGSAVLCTQATSKAVSDPAASTRSWRSRKPSMVCSDVSVMVANGQLWSGNESNGDPMVR